MNENLPAASVCASSGVGFSALCDVLTGFANFTAATPEAAVLAPAGFALFVSGVLLADGHREAAAAENSQPVATDGGTS